MKNDFEDETSAELDVSDLEAIAGGVSAGPTNVTTDPGLRSGGSVPSGGSTGDPGANKSGSTGDPGANKSGSTGDPGANKSGSTGDPGANKTGGSTPVAPPGRT